MWFAGNILKSNLVSQDQTIQTLGFLIFLLGFGLFIFGCTNYARAKGYHWALGFLGVLSLVGLIILAILPDKFKTVKSK